MAAVATLAALALAGSVEAGGVPVQVAVAGRTIWETSDSGVHVRDARSGRVVASPESTYPYATQIVVGGGAAWIASITNGYLAGAVDRIDLRSRRRTTPLRFPRRAVYAIAFGGETVWAWFGSPRQSASSLLVRVDTAGRKARTLRVPGRPGWMAASGRGLWLTDGRTLRFVDRASNRAVTVRPVPVETAPLAVGLGSVWIPSGRQIVRLDEKTHRRLASLQLPAGAILVATGAGHVWAAVLSGESARLLRFDPARAAVDASRALASGPSALVVDREHVWIGESGFHPRIVRLNSDTLRTEKVFTLGQ